MSEKILRLQDVIKATGLPRSTIYLRRTQGQFPEPVSLGGRCVGWLESDIQNWIRERAAMRAGQ